MSATHPTMARVFERTGLEPSALALEINVSPQSVTNWSKRGISKSGAMAVAEEFGYSVDWILTGNENNVFSGMTRILDESEICYDPAAEADHDPTSDYVPLFEWSFKTKWTIEDEINYVARPSNVQEGGFCLVVHNQSMSPEFNPEDMVFIDVRIDEDEYRDGDFIIVRKLGVSEAVLRQLLIGDSTDEKYVRPYNPNWVDQTTIKLDDSYEIIGKVVGKYVDYT